MLDAFPGAAGPELHRGLERAGISVIARRLIPNGAFPAGSPNPTSQGKMAEALELARATGAHCVIGIDGDGDRIVFGGTERVLSAGVAFIPILEQGLRTLPAALSLLERLGLLGSYSRQSALHARSRSAAIA